MNMNDLKSGEPFFGRWFIKDYIGSTSLGSLYLIYCIVNGVYEYSTMKVIGVPKDKRELKQIQFQVLDYDSTVQYYKELVTDMYREICLVEELNDKSHLVSYKDHMILQRGNGVGYDVFLRMEYLPNITEELQISDLNKQDVLRLGKDICEALRICENYHIFHGDLRPETIFATENGSFKLGDFSFSRFSKQEGVFNEHMDIADYMAPELYQGKVYDNRADIYSLGLVLYQLLNDNKLPYLTVPLQKATSIERQFAIRQRFENTMLPNPVHATEELAKVIIKACDLDPKQRYQSAEEFKDALTAIAIFLDADMVFQNKNNIIPEEIYINNEVVANSLEPVSGLQPPVDVSIPQNFDSYFQADVTLPKRGQEVFANLEFDRKAKRKRDKVKDENGKSMRPLFFILLLVVFAASLIAVFPKVDIIIHSPVSVIAPSQDTGAQLTTEPKEELTAQPTKAQEQEASAINEANLITIIESGKKLTSLETVTSLDKAIAIDLSNNKLTKIDELKDAVFAETLVLSHNDIVNVEALHALTSLKALDISNNQVTSFIKLRNLKQLEILSASNNLITSLDGLEKMTALKIVYLNGNSIKDISILKELTTLEVIDLSNNKIAEKDIKALKKALPECIIID